MMPAMHSSALALVCQWLHLRRSAVSLAHRIAAAPSLPSAYRCSMQHCVITAMSEPTDSPVRAELDRRREQLLEPRLGVKFLRDDEPAELVVN